MALHPVKIPKSATRLFRVVGLQKKLLRALANPALVAEQVDTAWVQQVWKRMDPEWVRKFCFGGKKSVLHPLKVIAKADPVARQTLYEEFRRQSNIKSVLDKGGDFRDLKSFPCMPHVVADAVKTFFQRCYKLLSHDTGRGWSGYEFGNQCFLTNSAYKADFCASYPTKSVCPYCDGEIGTPELDHYLPKSAFPFLACSPWNLVPVCSSCNNFISGKGERLALSPGADHPSSEWFHPYFNPASPETCIRLTGSPMDSIPVLYSPDSTEQIRLSNHTKLIPSLSKRWTDRVSVSFDVLVRQVNRKVKSKPGTSIKEIVNDLLAEHLDSRGVSPSSMVHAAVCRAVLDGRSGYLEEFASPNAPVME